LRLCPAQSKIEAESSHLRLKSRLPTRQLTDMHVNETLHLCPPEQSARLALQGLQPPLTRNDLVPVLHRPNAALLPRPVLQENLLRLSRMAFGRTVGALEARALGQLVQTFAGYDVAAGNHHGWVRISSLFLANGAHEDGVEMV
jgi:hypothetical protein